MFGEQSPAAGVPSNGIEYLMQVRYQARRTRFAHAKAPPASSLPTAAPHVASAPRAQWRDDVSSEWQRDALCNFALLRTRVAAHLDVEQSPNVLPPLPSANDAQMWRRWIVEQRQQPSLRIVAALGDVRVRGAIEHAAEWFAAPDAVLGAKQGRWLFALLAAVDLPLDADTAAALMSLYRSCKRLRARTTAAEHAHFDLLLTVIGYGFMQRDDDHL